MSEARSSSPTMVEVPASFCDEFVAGGTTEEPDPLGLKETAVLVVGGRESISGAFIPSVEVFGCPGSPGRYQAEDFPFLTSSAAGTFLHGEDGGEPGMAFAKFRKFILYKWRLFLRSRVGVRRRGGLRGL